MSPLSGLNLGIIVGIRLFIFWELDFLVFSPSDFNVMLHVLQEGITRMVMSKQVRAPLKVIISENEAFTLRVSFMLFHSEVRLHGQNIALIILK